MNEFGAVSKRIGRISKWMGWVTLALVALLVAADVILWTDRSILDRVIAEEILPAGATYSLTPNVLVAGFILAHIPFLIALWGLWNMWRLFRAYREGAVFSVETGRRLRNVGLVLGLQPFLQIALSGIGSILLTMNNANGERHFAITLQDNDLLIGIAGGLLVVVGWVMAEAARIADDHRQII